MKLNQDELLSIFKSELFFRVYKGMCNASKICNPPLKKIEKGRKREREKERQGEMLLLAQEETAFKKKKC